jgi:hypothetical protein
MIAISGKGDHAGREEGHIRDHSVRVAPRAAGARRVADRAR